MGFINSVGFENTLHHHLDYQRQKSTNVDEQIIADSASIIIVVVVQSLVTDISPIIARPATNLCIVLC